VNEGEDKTIYRKEDDLEMKKFKKEIEKEK